MALNLYSDISGIAQAIQEDARFAIRELGTMQNLIKNFMDASGGVARTGYDYNKAAASAIGESDDLVSSAFTPSAGQSLTPGEIGLQFFITDLRAETDTVENIMADAQRELTLAALDKVETDLVTDMASLTGGTVGAAGTAITWGYVAAAIAQARNANKNKAVPLSYVLHGYQWSVLAKAASIAGSSLAQAPGVTEEMTRRGYISSFMGVPMYQVYADADSADDFKGACFPMDALAIDWRRPIRVEAQRDASRRGWELNMTAVYAHGIWRPTLGIISYFDATAPTS